MTNLSVKEILEYYQLGPNLWRHQFLCFNFAMRQIRYILIKS